MVTNPIERFAPLLVTMFFAVEPLAPRYLSYYIRRYLKGWKNRGLILDYNVSTRRLGKFHYKVIVDLDLTPKQAGGILNQQLLQALERR